MVNTQNLSIAVFAMHYSKHLICISSFNPHNSMRYVLLSFPFYRQKKSTEDLSKLFNLFTQLVCGGGGTQSQVF